MARTFQLPDPGEGIHEAEIVEVRVASGDRVEESDVLLEVETDKAVVEIPSPFTGRVEEVLVSAGDEVRVGDDVLRWEPEESEPSGRDEAPAEEGAQAEDVSGEDQGDGDAADAEEDRGDRGGEAEAPERRETAEDGDASTKDPAEGDASEEEPADDDASGEERADDDTRPDPSGDGDGAERPVAAAPATRRLARELGVELTRVEGSGPEGRVTREDVQAAADEGEETEDAPAPGEADEEAGEEEAAAEEPGAREDAEPEAPEEGAPEEEAPAAGEEGREAAGGELAAGREAEEPARPEERPAGAVSAPRPDYGDPESWGPVRREPLRSVRRTTARRMADAWRRIPHVTHVDHADVTDLEGFRREHAEALEDADLTVTVFLLKALVAALKEFPRFNARLDEDEEEIVLLDYHHLGVAVDSERGLLVPVVRDVDKKSLVELAGELGELVEAVRDRRVTRDQMRGGSFTLTNPGPLGGDLLTPIVNPPQVAILGAGRAALRPAVVEGEDGPRLKPRRILPLCLSFDHRVNDGADAARFCARLVEILEDPDVFVRHL
jgi:pyruvate dehydrogenase E2 component (dihydrolipoamide acetyltransferase)